MLVNKTVEFFLSEAAGRGWRSAGAGSGAGDQITWASSGLGQDAGGSRGLGRDKMPAGAEAGTGSETKLRVYCCEKQDGTGGGAGDQITWAGSGLGAARDRTRYRRRPRLGPGQDAVGGRG